MTKTEKTFLKFSFVAAASYGLICLDTAGIANMKNFPPPSQQPQKAQQADNALKIESRPFTHRLFW